jgi:hypothetical protein
MLQIEVYIVNTINKGKSNKQSIENTWKLRPKERHKQELCKILRIRKHLTQGNQSIVCVQHKSMIKNKIKMNENDKKDHDPGEIKANSTVELNLFFIVISQRIFYTVNSFF